MNVLNLMKVQDIANTGINADTLTNNYSLDKTL